LRHDHHGVDLDQAKARDTLHNLFRVWRRPVGIATQVSGRETLLRYDGKEHTAKPMR
jgi:stage V sporulation protein R